jgi:hypothetical protein
MLRRPRRALLSSHQNSGSSLLAHKTTELSQWWLSGGWWSVMQFGLVFGFVLFWGAAIVVLPLWLSVRLLALMVFGAVVGFAWAFRSNRAGMAGNLLLVATLAAVLLSILWPRYIFFNVGPISFNPQSVVVLASVALGVVSLVYSPQLSTRFWQLPLFHGWLGASLTAWLLWRIFAAMVGEFPLASTLLVLRDMAYTTSFIMIAGLVVCHENGERWLFRVLLGAAIFVVAFGLVESFIQRNVLIRYAAGGDSEAVAEAIKSLTIEKVRGGKYRAQSVFSHPIVFSQFVAALVPLAVAIFLGERSRFWRLGALLLIPFALAALYATGSRSGAISMAATVGLTLLIVWIHALGSSGMSRVVALLAAPFLALSLVFMYFAAQELTVGRTANEVGSTEARLLMLRLGVKALADSPITGFGEGAAVSKAGLSDSAGHGSIDSLPLSIAVNTGYVGVTLFLGLFAIYATSGFWLAARRRDRDGLRLALITAAAVAVMAVFIGLSTSHNMTLLWVLMVVGCHQMKLLKEPRHNSLPAQGSPRLLVA